MSRIPKIFFQKSRDKLPQYIYDMIQISLTKEWVYTNYINGDEIPFFEQNPLEEFPDIISKFNSLKRGEHKADLFRYYFLYINGGVYMDSDAMIYEPIENIIKDYAFLSINSWIPDTISNHVLIAEKRNSVIYEALRNLYTMDITILDTDFHYICKDLYKIYNSLKNDTYILLTDISDIRGDRAIDSNGLILFKHFWRNKEIIPNHLLCLPKTVKHKHLLYFCVFFNEDYFKLLHLLLLSMLTYSSVDSFDMLIITSKDYEQTVHELSTRLNLTLQIMTCEFKTFFQAACARLYIFEYSNLADYEKILYLDTDILITSDLKNVFDLEIKDVLYALESGYTKSLNFGGQFFDESIPGQSGINSGTLFFLNSPTMKGLFSRIRDHINEFTKEGTKPPYCMDQPFINYHAIKDSLCDNKTLIPYINLFEGDTMSDEKKTICHFSYPIGNFWNKYNRMFTYFINNKIHSTDIIDRQYSWEKGYIKFIYDVNATYKINTTWGDGFFNVLNNFTVYVEWHNCGHILRFNSDYTEYTSIRIKPNDLSFVKGSLVQTNLNIYGDSHALLSFQNYKIHHRNLFEFGKTMYSLGRDKQITNFYKTQLDKDTLYCFMYGEVDVRAHIGKQVYYGKHHEQVCKELISAYFRTIKQQITEYKAIIIIAIPPPVDPKDHIHIHNPPIPFIGTNSDRIIYTNYMNELLKSHCLEYNYIFLNPYSYYTREDGCLNYLLSDQCLHIGKNTHFLDSFQSITDIPIVLHTCDSYKEFWNPWYYYTRKHIKKPYKIYFLSEEEAPDFVNDIIHIKTGKGEWGDRLLKGLAKISESYIYYMQEDFWPCNDIDLFTYTSYFTNYNMDCLRISDTSDLYTLEEIQKDVLYKFSQYSNYLMTHQFSLWNKNYFMKHILPTENPWRNELDMSKVIARSSHSIYLYKNKWYNSTVTKGVLQENGKAMLKLYYDSIT